MRNHLTAVVFLAFYFLTGCTSPEPSEPYKEQLTSELSDEEQELIAEIKETDILSWTPEMQLLGYQNTHEVSPARILKPADEPFPLNDADDKVNEVKYSYNDEKRDLSYFMEELQVAGLLVIQDGNVILEQYGYDNTESTTWISFSVTKSVLSMLFGAAIADGYIQSVEDRITGYLPELEGSAYEGVTIRHLLRMASGVAWNEDYSDPDSDVVHLDRIHTKEELISYMANLPRDAGPETQFNYNTGDTYLAGAVLMAATGQSLTEYANKRIWQGFGMEHPASWSLIGEDAMEHGGCCISASLRDYGRIGMMALQNGRNHQSDQLFPENWMEQSVNPSPANEGYGYFWWLQNDHIYEGRGIFGQYLHINENADIVIAMQSKWEDATDPELSTHRREFIRRLTEIARNPGN